MTEGLGSRRAFWLVLLATAGTFALTMGNRQSMGLFVSPLNTATGLGLASISLAFAVGQLAWGLTQPFAGAVADRYGAGRVLLAAVLLVALGGLLTPYMTTTLGLVVTIGILGAGGAGMAGPAVLMSTATKLIPPERRGLANGIVNAGGSSGQFLLTPVAAALIVSLGWVGALQAVSLLVLLALPAAYILWSGGGNAAGAAVKPPLPTREALRLAGADRSYRLLVIGFFVCGFHVAFLSTHLPGVVAACGLSTEWSGWALSMLGLFNIVGSVAIGWAMGRWRMKSLLALLYAVRGVAVLLFLLAPKTGAVVLVFAAVMGLTFLSTVPPTAGLVARLFGPANMAMLFGVVMLTHQVGGFLGAWMGGTVFQATGSYDWVWYVDIVLAAGAALLHLPIREAPLVRRAAAAAA
ncbi:MAG TPA: MFS transporter [Ramlibacter sp.]|nr:MFS transporter [Ramlibacter sp.]